MKLIVAGATGLLGTEIIRQTLQIPEITQVIALARKPIQIDGNLDSSKVKSVVIRDYGEYPDDVKAEFAGADACIWCVSIRFPYVASFGLYADQMTFFTHLGLSLLRPFVLVALTLPKSNAFVRTAQSSGSKPCTRLDQRVLSGSSTSVQKVHPGTQARSHISWEAIKSCA